MNKKKSITSIGIIGSGNVAYHMLRALNKGDYPSLIIYSRNDSEVKRISRGFKVNIIKNIKDLPDTIDVYIICISDDHIKSVINNLPKSVRNNCIIAHTSGSKSIKETLSSCRNAGVFYPLQTFTKGKRINYKNIPFCINGTSKGTSQILFDIASSISTHVVYIDDQQRKQIHLSAVWINNFVNHLIYKSEVFLRNSSIPVEILQPLLLETIKKQQSIGSKEAQTGPAIRNDHTTMQDHLRLLENQDDQKLYKILSQSILNTYK